ncbi:MAG: ABC transporter substrate-binding protein, partial [Bacteroidia bacterium]|nr:ABC transporter substrate-binding protein [Bacteroidia bacterium]
RATFVALELMQGVSIAADHLAETAKPAKPLHLVVEYFDSKREPSVAAAIVRNEIKAFAPHYLIGDLFNGGARAVAEALSAWKNPPLQLVPTSPAPELLQAADFVYLAVPSLHTQADALAQYGVEKAFRKRWLVVSDGSKNSEILAKRMIAALKNLKAEVDSFRLNTPLTSAHRSLFVNKITDAQADAIYFSFGDEEILSLVIKDVLDSGHEVQIFGTPDWSQFQNVENADLARLRTVYPDNLFPANDTATFRRFKKTYESLNHNTPSPYACAGYDLLRYLYYVHENGASAKPASERLRALEPWKGLVQNYYFAGARDNRSVQLIAVKTEGPEKILPWKQ